jgi:hypothetical protein
MLLIGILLLLGSTYFMMRAHRAEHDLGILKRGDDYNAIQIARVRNFGWRSLIVLCAAPGLIALFWAIKPSEAAQTWQLIGVIVAKLHN